MGTEPVASLSEYLATLDLVFSNGSRPLWFRGHGDLSWRLAPSALRYKKAENIRKALGLVVDFRRIADFRVQRPPPFDDGLKWMQLAQHYGLPTRLLDWTSNAAIALYFACLQPDIHGMVYVMDPTELNIGVLNGEKRLLDPTEDRTVIERYLKLPAKPNPRGKKPTIAIQPVINDERIQLQRGAFTLHGNREFDLTAAQVSSLCYIPVLAEHKESLIGAEVDVGGGELGDEAAEDVRLDERGNLVAEAELFENLLHVAAEAVELLCRSWKCRNAITHRINAT